ncbi:MAG: hypothetical protein U0R71_01785 [Solirubrobacterales bacterium]
MAEDRSALEERAIPTKVRLRAAIEAGRWDEAARLTDHLLVDWEEIRFLYPEFIRRTLDELRARVGADSRLEALRERLQTALGPEFEAAEAQAELEREQAALAAACREGTATVARMEALFSSWLALHDPWRDLLSEAIDVGVELLGEARLGELWAAIQADEIAGYERYDPAKRPWSESFEEVVQSALTGMNGHLCGPKFDGEIGVLEAEDRVELRFAPCGSGGRIREDPRFGVTAERHDWAWNKEGVCYYCVHCCVLQQLSPIDNLGTPVRVIEPPTSPGEACTWTVYRSLDLVPDAAFEAVGRERPEPA